VRNPRSPISARDQNGRDVLGIISRRDGQYLRPFERRIVQGLGEHHFLEMDLGALDDPEKIVLFLTGWIFPTDTSLNIAVSQNPAIDSPRPPSLWVPDENGEWREVMAYMGFPGGKTKTIAVALSDAFLTDDYRLRIKTNAEIYWDHAFFTVDEEPAELRLTELALASASLRYRGFSHRTEGLGNGPETYDYERVAVDPRWPPLQGTYTLYGDVADLIGSADDSLVVMAAGDDMSLRFKVPEAPLPEGWRRDFILHNVGWDKDADLNTIYGDMVQPLPYRAMPQYPYVPPRVSAAASPSRQSRRPDERSFTYFVKRYQAQ
jgi:hypothetical protein